MPKVKKRRTVGLDAAESITERGALKAWNCLLSYMVPFAISEDVRAEEKLIATKPSKWPMPIGQHAKNGVVGRFLDAVLPATEADEVALVAQLLTIFGNIVGRGPHFRVEADDHYLKLFVVIVGKSAKSRKGVSYSRVLECVELIDESWSSTCVNSGLSSGEGLIDAVRDARTIPKRTKQGELTTQQIPGVEDKRLLVYEPEFASVLSTMRREGNTLSTLLRQAWDNVPLQTMTRNEPLKATDSHISIISHITEVELKQRLSELDAANGFANRFMFICVQRSKLLPHGHRVDDSKLKSIQKELGKAASFARTVRELKLDADARKIWEKIYAELSIERDGLYDALTSRADAHIRRIACIYALLDLSQDVRTCHLLAAKAFWDYCDESVRYLFGKSLGDPVSDQILANLRERPQGMTRSEIHGVFSRSKSAERIQNGLERLGNLQLVRVVVEETGGRPLERWFAI